MASFAVNTGVRAENVCNLKWDWEQRLPEIGRSVFVIPASEFKSGRSHVVILNDAAQAVIQSMREKHEDRALLQGHATKSMPQHYATAIVERLVEQANKV